MKFPLARHACGQVRYVPADGVPKCLDPFTLLPAARGVSVTRHPHKDLTCSTLFSRLAVAAYWEEASPRGCILYLPDGQPCRAPFCVLMGHWNVFFCELPDQVFRIFLYVRCCLLTCSDCVYLPNTKPLSLVVNVFPFFFFLLVCIFTSSVFCFVFFLNRSFLF